MAGHHVAGHPEHLEPLGLPITEERGRRAVGAQPISATGLVRPGLLIRNRLARNRETIVNLIVIRQGHTVLSDEEFVRTEFV